jgi:hypothetical protein
LVAIINNYHFPEYFWLNQHQGVFSWR